MQYGFCLLIQISKCSMHDIITVIVCSLVGNLYAKKVTLIHT